MFRFIAQINGDLSSGERPFGSGALTWLLIFLALGLGGFLVVWGRRGYGSLAALTTPTPTPIPTFTPAPTITLTPTPIPTPTLGVGSAWQRPADGMRMVYIPEGHFQMGSVNEDSDEQPVHRVSLDAFWLDQHEVTNAMYAAFLNAQGNQQEGGASWLETQNFDVRIHQQEGRWQADEGYADHPVIKVTWYGARAYCVWVGGRLPSEAEWEYAARGGLSGADYPWGDEMPVCTPGAVNGAQYSACDGETAPVMTFAPNGYGLYDMAGNVWEWVNDWYDSAYYQNAPQENPLGPVSGTYRVLRGGSWYNSEYLLRVANRVRGYPNYAWDDSGFRCARSP